MSILHGTPPTAASERKCSHILLRERAKEYTDILVLTRYDFPFPFTLRIYHTCECCLKNKFECFGCSYFTLRIIVLAFDNFTQTSTSISISIRVSQPVVELSDAQPQFCLSCVIWTHEIEYI